MDLHDHEEVCLILSHLTFSPNSSVCFISYDIILLNTGEPVKENVIYSLKINIREVSQPLAKDKIFQYLIHSVNVPVCIFHPQINPTQ